jgi:hypothetical protein
LDYKRPGGMVGYVDTGTNSKGSKRGKESNGLLLQQAREKEQ